jgi:hypothetical protein
MKIAKSVLRELNLDVSGEPTVAVLEIDPHTLTANFPSDYITYRKIAISWNNVLLPLAKNENIRLNGDNACNTSRVNTPLNYEQGIYDGLGLNATRSLGLTGMMPLLGLGGDKGNIPHYRIDTQHGYIQFDSNLLSPIVMEYLADPKMVNGKFEVPIYVVEALKAGIAWRNIENNDQVSVGAKRAKELQYTNKKMWARIRYMSSTLDEIYQYARRTFSQSART